MSLSTFFWSHGLFLSVHSLLPLFSISNDCCVLKNSDAVLTFNGSFFFSVNESRHDLLKDAFGVVTSKGSFLLFALTVS